ncbi:uncharacterized protein BDW47DRAFT_113848 [Aspergillus candidus]|uniref:Uncharacterized protein n=1 Tax=Aspergillus candidus TaxID=41067 RepID=A0A2I2EYP4_ASPCN|nr:hypothetical protein BDW47DRAFT_113848 [Aspergillus candidus]PLB33492.1 hypothetical protein BDW47DRAFT_113848 [Aspergillus candidus]
MEITPVISFAGYFLHFPSSTSSTGWSLVLMPSFYPGSYVWFLFWFLCRISVTRVIKLITGVFLARTRSVQIRYTSIQ